MGQQFSNKELFRLCAVGLVRFLTALVGRLLALFYAVFFQKFRGHDAQAAADLDHQKYINAKRERLVRIHLAKIYIFT